MNIFLSLFMRLALGSALLGACSPAPPDSAPAGGQGATVTPKRPGVGARADSLGGISGHHFGEPLDKFPGLTASSEQPLAPAFILYHYADGDKREPGWFGKHRPELSSTTYYFQNGWFAGFDAEAFGDGKAVLGHEVNFLMGRGKPSDDATTWEGEKAWAEFRSFYRSASQGYRFQIFSKTALAEQQRQQQVRLRAENAAR